jgi:predicted acylesterase/phospholipase RssA
MVNDKALPEAVCDIVLKGGITSGIVYPLALVRLAEQFRFSSIGGSSAGAIAAAAACAAAAARARYPRPRVAPRVADHAFAAGCPFALASRS